MTQSNRLQLTAVVLLFLLIIGILLVILPMRSRNAALKVTHATALTERQQLEDRLEKLEALSEQVASSAAAKKTLLQAVPKGLNQDELILELKELSDKVSYDLSTMSFSVTNSAEFGNTVSIGASLSGGYSDLIAFLRNIENADRLFRVKSIAAQRTNNEGVYFNVVLEAFYQ